MGTYSFRYTNSKAQLWLVLSVLIITIGLIVFAARSEHATTLAIIILILMPVTILSLKKLVIRQCIAILQDNSVHFTLDNKEYEFPFSGIKSYKYQNGLMTSFVIADDNQTISIPIHQQFIDAKGGVEFFDDFDIAIKKYAKKHPSVIVKTKPYTITKDGRTLLKIYTFIVVPMLFYAMNNLGMPIYKGWFFIALIIVFLIINNNQKKKYDRETPDSMYDYEERGAKAKRKPILISIIVLFFAGFLINAWMIIPQNNNKYSYITRDYTTYLNKYEASLVDLVNSILIPYSSINSGESYGDSTYLEIAISNDNVEAVAEMLKHNKINLETYIKDEQTPLMLALDESSFNVAKFLIKNGAKLDHIIISDKYDPETMYTYLSGYRDREKYSWLLQYDINYENKRMMSITLGELDDNLKDVFVSKLHRQLNTLKNRDKYAQNLFEFTMLYLNTDDKDFAVQTYLTSDTDFTNRYEIKKIQNKLKDDDNYQASNQEIEILLRAYKSGYRDVVLDLAWLYENRKQYDQAILWYKKAIETDKDGTAEYCFAYMYSNLLHDKKNAIKYYQLSIKKGNTSASSRLVEEYPEINNDMYNDIALMSYAKLKPLEKTALTNATDAITLAEHYSSLNIGKFKRAFHWYNIALKNGNKEEIQKAKFSMGFAYFEQNKYKEAIEIFMDIQDYKNVKLNIGKVHYYNQNYSEAMTWYKKALKDGDIEAAESIGRLYHEQKDNLKSAVYMIAVIGHTDLPYRELELPYTKESVLTLLRDDWKIDEATLENAYNLQLELDIPKHYIGGIN